MSGRKPASKVMYVVEKFLPQECPKCRRKFDKIGVDWKPLLGDIIDGEKVIRETIGYSIIMCSRCQNYTASIPLESYTLSDPEDAKKLLDHGFVNFRAVEAFGNMVKDRHVVYTKLPDVRVEAVKRD